MVDLHSNQRYLVWSRALPYFTSYGISLQPAELLAHAVKQLVYGHTPSFTCANSTIALHTIRGRRMTSNAPVVVLRSEHRLSRREICRLLQYDTSWFTCDVDGFVYRRHLSFVRLCLYYILNSIFNISWLWWFITNSLHCYRTPHLLHLQLWV